MAGGTTTHYVHGLGGKLYGEYDNAGVLIREYVWLNGEPLAQIDAGSPEVLTYLHTDHLQTPRYGTNAAGSTVWTWDSGAFGKEAPTGTATVNLRFPGQYYDSESTLFYNWNRYYNPAIGRYISSDPIGLEGGLNTFLYADASPLGMFDLLGLKSGDPYPSVLLAVSGAFVEALSKSDVLAREYGGLIYKFCNSSGHTFYTYTIKGLNAHGGSLGSTSVTQYAAAGWHTHTKSRDFSGSYPTTYWLFPDKGDDLRWVQNHNKDLYLGLPKGIDQGLPVHPEIWVLPANSWTVLMARKVAIFL